MSYAAIHSEILLQPESFTDLEPAAPLKTKNPRHRRKRGAVATVAAPMEHESPLVVHSHLCWDWVWQRPQQFMSRLSRNHRVLFIETVAPDPHLAAPLARFSTPDAFPGLTVLRLQFPSWRWADGAYVDAERRRLVQEFLRGPGARRFDKPIQWFYDPMAVTAFAGQLGEILTVYDCMDELSKFRGAPPEIAQRERELLARADVVFTGGHALFEAKSRLHNNCHFYGCGVDAKHFGRARAANMTVPDEVAAVPRPILGFFGVVDERMDYDLLERLADADPHWSIVIIGPAIKIDAAALPQRPNLHWLGQKSYADLPAFCKAFDLCLMPFALNEATRFINPTKALEYMATGRPIISTAVPDVVRNFGAVVRVANDADDFIAACRQALDQPNFAAIGRGFQMAAENSWDAVVGHLEQHLRDARARKAGANRHASANGSSGRLPFAATPRASEP